MQYGLVGGTGQAGGLASSNHLIEVAALGGISGAPAHGPDGLEIHYPGFLVPDLAIAGFSPDIIRMWSQNGKLRLAWSMVFGATNYTIYVANDLETGFVKDPVGVEDGTGGYVPLNSLMKYYRIHAALP